MFFSFFCYFQNAIHGEFDYIAGKQALLSLTHNPFTGVSNYTSLAVIDFNKVKAQRNRLSSFCHRISCVLYLILIL